MKSTGTLFELISQAEMKDATPVALFYVNEKTGDSDFITPEVIELPPDMVDGMVGKLERFKFSLLKSIQCRDDEEIDDEDNINN